MLMNYKIKSDEWDFSSNLLTAKEREIALDDMRERTGEINPSLDDCVYIGTVYQNEKDIAHRILILGEG
jgi:hypothetical protein